MKELYERVRAFFRTGLWTLDTASRGRPAVFLITSLRIVIGVVREVLSGRLTLRAMGLVYTTLLSLVPLLAVSFSVLKAFGVHNALLPLLSDFLAPLGPRGADLARQIVQFVNNMKVGVLGFVGLGVLIYTAVSLVQQVEEALNAVWRVRSMRGILHRFSGYLSVILVGPALVVSALGVTASFMSTTLMHKLMTIRLIGPLVSAAGELVPYVLVCAAFTVIYVFVPNTKVRLGPALTGALVGGVLWETVGWGFASFVVTSTRYGAIYSGFAALVLFILWLYLSWLILLVGAETAFYRQNPQYLKAIENVRVLDARLIEQTAVAVMALIARHFSLNRPQWTVHALAQRLGLAPEQVEEVVDALKSALLITETADRPPALLPSRDIGTIALCDVYGAVRGKTHQSIAPVEEVEGVVARVDEAIARSLDNTTLGALVPAPATASDLGKERGQDRNTAGEHDP